MKQTLERILNLLEHAQDSGIVFVRADRGNMGITQRMEVIWMFGGVITLGAGIVDDGSKKHDTIEITSEEYNELKPLFPVPDFNGYSFQKSEPVALRELSVIYRKIAVDELIADPDLGKS